MSIALRSILLASGLGLIAGAAAAQSPALEQLTGCTHYLTVQQRGCRVAQHFQCNAPAGSQIRVDYTEEGAVFMSAIDAEAQWIESRSLLQAQSRETLFPAPDAASISTLLAEGYDDFTFEQRFNGQSVLRHEGFDRLTGENVTIDGEELLGTEYYGLLTDPTTGQVIDEIRGREFVSPRHRRFFSGARTAADGGVPIDNTPVKFFYPGDEGFESTAPRYDCDMMLSALPNVESQT